MNEKKLKKLLLQEFSENPAGVRFTVLCSVCVIFFCEPRHKSSSHHVYKTPWSGDPRVNSQNNKGMGKAYQVKQVFKGNYQSKGGGIMSLKNDNYTYRVIWSEEDQEHVGLCAEFPSLSWLSTSPEKALKGVRAVVTSCVEDLVQNDEPVPLVPMKPVETRININR